MVGGVSSQWPVLVERKPQHLARQRAESAMKEAVDAFFSEAELSLPENRPR